MVAWFDQVVVGAIFKCLDKLIFIRLGGQDDDVDKTDALAIADGSTQIQSAHPRHIPVRDDDGRPFRRQYLYGFFARGGRQDFVPGPGQVLRDQSRRICVIVNDENT